MIPEWIEPAEWNEASSCRQARL